MYLTPTGNSTNARYEYEGTSDRIRAWDTVLVRDDESMREYVVVRGDGGDLDDPTLMLYCNADGEGGWFRASQLIKLKEATPRPNIPTRVLPKDQDDSDYVLELYEALDSEKKKLVFDLLTMLQPQQWKYF